MKINNSIEINRAGSLLNFERIFNTLNDKAWNIAIKDSKKEREGSHAAFENACDIALENVSEIINRLFDLEQAVASMPKDVQDAVWTKYHEVYTEREAIDEDEED